MDQKGLRETFLAEVDELLSDFEDGLVSLETTPDDAECIHRVFRAMHTLKSSAGMFGVEPVVAIAHTAESVLDRVRARKLAMDQTLTTIMLSAVDLFRESLSEFSEGSTAQFRDEHRALVSKLSSYIEAPAAAPAAPEVVLFDSEDEPEKPAEEPLIADRVYRIRMRFPQDMFETGQDPGLLLLELSRLGKVLEVTVDTSALPTLAALQPTKCYVGWDLVLQTQTPRQSIDEVFIFLEDRSNVTITDVTADGRSIRDLADTKIGELLIEEGQLNKLDLQQALGQQKPLGQVLVEMGKVSSDALNKVLKRQQAARQVQRSTTIRVDTDKLDKLVNLVGEMVIAIARVNQTAHEGGAADSVHLGAIEALDQIGRDLQGQVMSVRMVAIEETFSRFKRTVRDTAQELGKLVVLETLGNETELDKNVIEQLADPLKHMVRNAIGHGLETPEERVKAGKSDTGRLRLSAAQRQGHIVIEVSDDGRGIDTARVLEKARQNGIVRRDETLTEPQILKLIFEPGFSTAEQVNEISGRGVGLDVVMRNVKNLRGNIDISSTLGQGTTFTITLPLTLAIIDGMNVRVGAETLSIPLQSVVELFAPRAEQLQTVEGRGELVEVRGEYLPVVRLGEVLEADMTRKLDKDTTVVVVENNQRKFGIIVDRVLGMEQAVVKPLKKTFSVVQSLDDTFEKPEAVAGATILGNGHVALILDVPGIERMAFGGVQ